MKIACVSQRYFPVIGGSENLAKQFMDYLSLKNDVTVYTTLASDVRSFWNKNLEKVKSEDHLNYKIIRYDFLTPAEIKNDENLEKFSFASNYPGPFSPQMWQDLFLQKIEYDLIFTTAYPYDHVLSTYAAAKKWKIPLVIMPLIHQEFPELYLTSLKMNILANADAIFVLSESEKRILINDKIDENKISIIRPPFYLERWRNANPQRFKKHISIRTDQKVILYSGSKSFLKGIIHLIEAMKLVWQSHPDVLLVTIGPSTREFDTCLSDLPVDLKKKIIDLGVVDEEMKMDAFIGCDILTLPSKSESLGLVYLEAWICEKPVIGCDIPPISELIEHEKNGIKVQFGNVKQLADAITYLVDNPEVCKELGKVGKKKAELFNAKTILPHFEDVLVSVVKNFRDKKLG